jgi:hypothetical protein
VSAARAEAVESDPLPIPKGGAAPRGSLHQEALAADERLAE